MASACALAMFRGKNIFISRLSRSAERSKRHFTGGVVEGNGICSTAFCESAALRGKVFAEFQRAEPSQSSLRDASSPERGSFIRANRKMPKSSPFGGAGTA